MKKEVCTYTAKIIIIKPFISNTRKNPKPQRSQNKTAKKQVEIGMKSQCCQSLHEVALPSGIIEIKC